MKFRPCIDLRGGKVVQIVGGTLEDSAGVASNFETDREAADFADRYRADGLAGGHIIALGPGNEAAALSALHAFPGGLQYGGGVTLDNAVAYLEAGASHVIVTSFVFRSGKIDYDRLRELRGLVGCDRLTLDLSCRKRDNRYWVVTDRWSRFTDLPVEGDSLSLLSEYCNEFLVHGVDVEGLMSGLEEPLVQLLGERSPIPVTYAGGAKSLSDLDRVQEIGKGRVDLTIGSALDLFGGTVAYEDVVRWHRQAASSSGGLGGSHGPNGGA